MRLISSTSTSLIATVTSTAASVASGRYASSCPASVSVSPHHHGGHRRPHLGTRSGVLGSRCR